MHAAGLPLGGAGLNDGQRAALEVAEAARDGGAVGGGVGAGLFLGRFDPRRLHPFPQQDAEDRRIGDELVARVSAFLAEHLDADEVDESRVIPAPVIDGLRDLGVFRMKVPAAYGGLGLSQVNYNRVIMAIASHCGSTAVLVSAHQSIGVPQPLKMFGTDAQKERYLTRISRGDLSAFALTEPGVGSDPAQMSTTAARSDDGSHYLLNGTKLWTTNGPIAQLLVVMARTEAVRDNGRSRPRITAFIVEADQEGVEVVHRCDFMGLRAIQNGVLRFRNVKVPAENVLWGEGKGLKLALRTLNTGRLTLPAACCGIGKQCLAIARRWGGERVQWGLPVGRHEAGRDKIATTAAETYAMEAVTWLTSHQADQGRDVRVEAAMAKLFCSETCWRIVDRTLQLRGGRGYERALSLRARGEAAYPVERILRDCRINTIIEGTSEIMRLFLAREALDPHLRRAGDLLRRGVPAPRRAAAVIGLLWFYARWYPGQLAGRWMPRRPGGPDRLARHDRYVARSARRLALALFHAMVRHGPKLERRQLKLGRLMDAATELFTMAAVCAMARRDERGDGGAALADLFCRQARRRVERAFRGRPARERTGTDRVAAAVLDGDCLWLEEGIIAGPDVGGRGPRS